MLTPITPMGRPPPHVHSHPPRPIKSSTPIPQTPPLANSTTYGTPPLGNSTTSGNGLTPPLGNSTTSGSSNNSGTSLNGPASARAFGPSSNSVANSANARDSNLIAASNSHANNSSATTPQTPPLANSTAYGSSFSLSGARDSQHSHVINSNPSGSRDSQNPHAINSNPSVSSFNQSHLSTFGHIVNSSRHHPKTVNEHEELVESTGEQMNTEFEHLKSSGGNLVQPAELSDEKTNENQTNAPSAVCRSETKDFNRGKINEETGFPDSNINSARLEPKSPENNHVFQENSPHNRENSNLNSNNNKENIKERLPYKRESSNHSSSQKTVNNDVLPTVKQPTVPRDLANNINQFNDTHSRRQLNSCQSRATEVLVAVHRSSTRTMAESRGKGNARMRTDEERLVRDSQELKREDEGHEIGGKDENVGEMKIMEGTNDERVRSNEETCGKNDGTGGENYETRGIFNSSRENISSEEESLCSTPGQNSSTDMETMESGVSIVGSNTKLPNNINRRGNTKISQNIETFSQNIRNCDNSNGNGCKTVQAPILETEIDTFDSTRTIDARVSNQNIDTRVSNQNFDSRVSNLTVANDNARNNMDVNRNNVEKIDELSVKTDAANRNTTIDSSIFLDNRGNGSQWSTLDYSGSISNNDLEESTSVMVDSQCEDRSSSNVPQAPSKQRLYQEMCTEL
uniref:Uncharacterized protein n=1 Tax=Cacopsylla melanoneura TaxID=428564 RepID=A0A8D9F4A3_9HEMI